MTASSPPAGNPPRRSDVGTSVVTLARVRRSPWWRSRWSLGRLQPGAEAGGRVTAAAGPAGACARRPAAGAAPRRPFAARGGGSSIASTRRGALVGSNPVRGQRRIDECHARAGRREHGERAGRRPGRRRDRRRAVLGRAPRLRRRGLLVAHPSQPGRRAQRHPRLRERLGPRSPRLARDAGRPRDVADQRHGPDRHARAGPRSAASAAGPRADLGDGAPPRRRREALAVQSCGEGGCVTRVVALDGLGRAAGDRRRSGPGLDASASPGRGSSPGPTARACPAPCRPGRPAAPRRSPSSIKRPAPRSPATGATSSPSSTRRAARRASISLAGVEPAHRGCRPRRAAARLRDRRRLPGSRSARTRSRSAAAGADPHAFNPARPPSPPTPPSIPRRTRH